MDEDLSPRESEVLSLIAAGNSDKLIADQLAIPEDAVKGEVKSILSKLGVNDWTRAPKWLKLVITMGMRIVGDCVP